MFVKVLLIIACVFGAIYIYFRARQSRQLQFIKSYRFHPVLKKQVLKHYPHLSDSQLTTVFDALRDYFIFCHQAKNKMVAMPSQVVDIAWHEFILFTREYERFSKKAIGRFLHHTPTEAMQTRTSAQEGIKRVWRLACNNEGISPASPQQLPLLFAIDATLNIKDGFIYSLNCKKKSSPHYRSGYCAGHIGCASGCGGESGSSDEGGGFFSGDSDSGGGCGGGCGGD